MERPGRTHIEETERAPATSDTSAVAALLARARAHLDRVEPDRLAAEMAAGALVVDTRPVEQRRRDGELPGAVVVDRNVLEWRLDPTSPYRLPQVTDGGLRVIVVCDEGFSSSLAAATLREIGLRRATDLVGGYRGWLAWRGNGANDGGDRRVPAARGDARAALRGGVGGEPEG